MPSQLTCRARQLLDAVTLKNNTSASTDKVAVIAHTIIYVSDILVLCKREKQNKEFDVNCTFTCLKLLDDPVKTNKGDGPDGIHPIIVLKWYADLLKPVTSIFKLSMSIGVFFSIWKRVFVTPISKNK